MRPEWTFQYAAVFTLWVALTLVQALIILILLPIIGVVWSISVLARGLDTGLCIMLVDLAHFMRVLVLGIPTPCICGKCDKQELEHDEEE